MREHVDKPRRYGLPIGVDLQFALQIVGTPHVRDAIPVDCYRTCVRRTTGAIKYFRVADNNVVRLRPGDNGAAAK
jgi:hypothetical protein